MIAAAGDRNSEGTFLQQQQQQQKSRAVLTCCFRKGSTPFFSVEARTGWLEKGAGKELERSIDKRQYISYYVVGTI